jgi:hypothetical protein
MATPPTTNESRKPIYHDMKSESAKITFTALLILLISNPDAHTNITSYHSCIQLIVQTIQLAKVCQIFSNKILQLLALLLAFFSVSCIPLILFKMNLQPYKS